MATFFLASFNRASNGAIAPLRRRLEAEGMLTVNPEEADYIIAVGDRSETFDFVLKCFRENKPIIHLWAGEISQGTHDEVYRHAMTLMSMMQLCTNERAAYRVMQLCRAVDKKPNIYVVGNLMLDDLECDFTAVPSEPYILVLYNPPTLHDEEYVKTELDQINHLISYYKQQHSIKKVVWIEPNGDKYSDLVMPYVTHRTLPRPQFLGLIKKCEYFLTNSSCQYYEAPFLMPKENIIPIGERNMWRESRFANMSIRGAVDNIIKLLKEL